ncbi:MAG: helicase-associated domain-containing protein, partial [Candidatus Sabulitectum sp.]|nr:helicase-associated domain-containing protein [Candidatus Sabulitectum sp.]
ETQVTPCPPFLIDDMTIMLTEASLSPIPLRQSDNKPYAKSIKEISSRFYQLPPECNHLFTYTDEERIRMAMLTLTNHDLAGIHGKKRRKKDYLYAEEAGRDWLKLSERHRLEEMLFIQRNHHKRFYNLNRSSFPLDSKCLSKIKIIRDEFSVPYTTPNLAGSLYGALKILADVNHPVTETSFFERQVFLENPLFTLLQCGLPYMNTTDWQFHNIVDKQEMIHFWLHSLQSFIVRKAIPYGMLNISPICGEDDYAISLSDAGLFFTGNLKKLPVAKQSGDSVLIQPNFEIVFMTQNPTAEVKLGQFCERLGSGIGTLFKITSSSVLKAASHGLNAEYVLDTMAELSHKPVPPNVTEQVKNWISRCRIVSISTKILFTCPDRETALQVKSSGGEKVEHISDTVIAVSDKKFAKALEKKLEKKGIFKKRGP